MENEGYTLHLSSSCHQKWELFSFGHQFCPSKQMPILISKKDIYHWYFLLSKSIYSFDEILSYYLYKSFSFYVNIAPNYRTRFISIFHPFVCLCVQTDLQSFVEVSKPFIIIVNVSARYSWSYKLYTKRHWTNCEL
jgi:hypothetical protein